MEFENAGEIKRNAITATISNTIDSEDDKTFLKDFNRLELKQQQLILKLLIEASEVTLSNCIKSSIPFSIPFVGRIHIPEGKQIDLDNREAIANQHGYKDFDSMPKDVHIEASNDLNQIVTEEFIRLKNNRKCAREARKKEPKPVFAHQTGDGRIKQFIDINKIKQWLKKQ